MKKAIVIGIVSLAVMALTALQARASVTISGQAFGIQDNLGNDAPLNTVGLFIVDENNDGIGNGPLASGSSIALGASFGGADNIIVGVSDIANTEGVAGTIDFGANFTLTGGFAAGQNVAFVWLPNQTLANTTLAAGWYGWTEGGSDFGDPWVVPADGSTVSIDFFTESQGGTHADAEGLASHQIIPEPSSIMLVVLGLVGMAGLIRRRS